MTPITEKEQLKQVVEALLMASARPLKFKEISQLLCENGTAPDTALLKAVVQELSDECAGRGIELVAVASGYRYQTRACHAGWLLKLWDEKPPRYSKACLETLALIAYRQPITRASIEEVRGVAVSTNILRTLDERGWIRICGHKETPGRPALYATTQNFLDDFNIRSLAELPKMESVAEIVSENPILELTPAASDQTQPEASPQQSMANTDAAKESEAGTYKAQASPQPPVANTVATKESEAGTYNAQASPQQSMANTAATPTLSTDEQ